MGVVVSLLLWPRGVKTAVQQAIDAAREVGSRYLRAAVLRVTRGAFEQAENQVNALSHDALTVSEHWMMLCGNIFRRTVARLIPAPRSCGRPAGRFGCARPPT